MRLIKSIRVIFLTITIIFQPFSFQKVIIPVTYLLDDNGLALQSEVDKALSSFILEKAKSDCFSLEGIYVKDKLQLPVTDQPAGQPGFVSNSKELVTVFSTASDYGSIGLIAHNHLAGKQFFEIDTYDEINLVYGDGHVEKYIVSEIREYQALSPDSPYSSFVNLTDPNNTISYRDLFFETYGVDNQLILQTCISKEGSDSWGRLFVIALPIESILPSSITP